MTQKMTSDNGIVADNVGHVARESFLQALYPNLSEKLWLELRCIHPSTGEVRRLWTHPGNAKQSEAVLSQSEKLNRDGFGVYFAPCLRKSRQGKTESAALLPALWVDIDCEGDVRQREQGLAKLHAFDPPPSYIIDSGGGWHGYWLLDEPFTLATDDDKTKIAQILHGLFAALDGDTDYVKSVASVMRLPGSTNTKPERNNLPVTVLEAHPDRRYPLHCFDWLAVKPKTERIGGLNIVTLNGAHPLPPRTEQYLTSGAHNGNRNAELFAAACQMRDAGHSQHEAERQLIPRHVADGDGSENPSAREREAKATITSAYSQAPRDPIALPQQSARERISQLVGQYATEKAQRASTAEIVAAVEACIHLNPVEWAEEREQLCYRKG